ncbi:MAG: STAS domain-containing protein [Candidatus Desulfofervidus sp.]|nr:STAS domain-containing protein [Candidatus Desulfofervidus sp.]
MGFKSYEIQGKVGVIETPKRVDITNAEELKKIMADYVKKEIFKIVVNLEETGFIDSSGLGSLVSQIATCRANGGDVRLAGAGKEVMRVLEITQLDKVLKLFSGVEEAINSYG